MASIAPIDKVEIRVLVDNATDSLSTISAHAESEFTFLERHGMRELSGDVCACHGLSLLITATCGAQMGITEVVTAPRSPWQNAYVERVYRFDPARVSRSRRNLQPTASAVRPFFLR